jgi:tRNA 2-thiouridine synthesizing protein B
MILHIVNQSPFCHDALSQCLRCIGADDSILLIEDGTLLLSNPSHISNLPAHTNLFVLESDAHARGMDHANNKIAVVVNYEGFVDLVVKHNKTISWF